MRQAREAADQTRQHASDAAEALRRENPRNSQLTASWSPGMWGLTAPNTEPPMITGHI
jgi:hypothetical protein